jgi:hypothetical protein
MDSNDCKKDEVFLVGECVKADSLLERKLLLTVPGAYYEDEENKHQKKNQFKKIIKEKGLIWKGIFQATNEDYRVRWGDDKTMITRKGDKSGDYTFHINNPKAALAAELEKWANTQLVPADDSELHKKYERELFVARQNGAPESWIRMLEKKVEDTK